MPAILFNFQPGKGHLFEVPVTVVVAEALSVSVPRPFIEKKEVTFKPGDISRTFVEVPDGATWCSVKVLSHEKETSGKFVLHTIQLLPKLVVKTMEHHKMFTLQESGEFNYSISVRGKMSYHYAE